MKSASIRRPKCSLRSVVALALLGLGCSGNPAAPPRPLAPAPPRTAAAPAAPPAPAESRGGIWMPEQIPGRAEELKALGLTLDPALLSDPLSSVLGAVVNFGGCSASFVSPEGLVITNHHCSVGALQFNSTPEQNLLEHGYSAGTPSDERWCGPTGRIFITQKLSDVTKDAEKALAGVADDLARARALERFEKERVRACEKGRPALRCELRSFYQGLKFYLVERLELRDVRLVYAPPAGIGNYGGEIDNWRWPRHTGDFAFFRAYVSPQGESADYDVKNVPYRPPHHLALATSPLREGDLAVVAGYPGRTSALEVSRVLEETAGWLYPRRLKLFDQYIQTIEAVTKTDPDAAIKGVGWLRRFNNFRTKHQGELFGFERGRVIETKRAEEEELRAFIAADEGRRARYGGALEAIDAAITEKHRTREADAALETEILLPRLLWAASLIVRMVEERQKPDVDRDPRYQERVVPDLRDELEAMDKRYHPAIDRAMLTLALERVLERPRAERTRALELIAGKNPTRDSIRAAVDKLYASTELADAKRRHALFDSATPKALERSPDTMIRAAVALRPLLRELEEREDRFAGKMLVEGPRVLKAQLEQKGGALAPDANRTLRVSYGTVRSPAGKTGGAFTLLAEVVKKHQDKDPFDAPDALLEAARARRPTPYLDPALGDVPVDFLTDAQITNGSSGSPTLDREGKLVGLAFDGTFESVASDWVYLPGTRSIHVDIRYVLWVLSEVAKADRILRELGVAPGGPTGELDRTLLRRAALQSGDALGDRRVGAE